MMAAYLEELRDVIRRLHGAEATHVESVPVKESFQRKTVWDGMMEVFDLKGHPRRSEFTHGRMIRMTRIIPVAMSPCYTHTQSNRPKTR